MAEANKTMYLRLRPEVYDAVEKKAKEDNSSMSEVISVLVRKHLKDKK